MAFIQIIECRTKKFDQIQRLEEDKIFDISAARADLGFSPCSFEEGIRRKLAGDV